MATENRYKIRLKDTKFPSGSSTTTAYLYPVAPIDGLVESADNPVNAYNVVTINDGSATRSIGRIKAQYLDIMLNDTGYATGNYHINNNYLNFITTVTIDGVATQKISNNYLNIWSTTEGTTEHPQIDKQYLPGYVDDVIDVQVLESGYPPQPAEGQTGLFIRKEGTVYTFMTWNTSTQTWVPGGGELGKIYVDAASGSSDIFRAVESGGVVSTQAVLISSSPLNIMSTNTNGVYLYKDGNNNVFAKADQANGGLYRFGTVVTATGEENYNDLLNVQQLSVFSIVPDVEYVKALVRTASITLDAGNAIDATLLTGGTVSCLTAGPAQPGVVRTVAAISDAATYASDQVPDAGAVRTYVGTALTDYQLELTPGNGIDITGTVISAKVTDDAWMSLTTAGITVLAATGSRKGVVRTVTDINANYASDAAIAAHPEGVVSFVKSMLDAMTYADPQNWVTVKNPTISYNTSTHVLSITGGSITVAVASTSTEGVVKLSDNLTGTEAAGSTVAATPYAVTQAISGASTAIMGVVNGKQDILSAGRAIDATELAGGTVTVQEAETSKPGVVVLADSLGQGTYAAHVVPTPEAVESYVTTEMAKKQGAFQIASGITSDYNAQTSVTTLLADVQDQAWMILNANGIGVSSATDGTTGVVTLHESIDTSLTSAVLKKAVPSVAGVTAYVGGIQATLEGEISGLNTSKMDKFTLGNGLSSNVVTATGTTVSAKVNANQSWMMLDANGIGVSSATVDTQAGIVTVKGTVDNVAPWTTAVPTVSAVKVYVDDAVSTKQDTLTFVSGTFKSNGYVSAVVNAATYPWMHLDAAGIGVKTANVTTGVAGVVTVTTSLADDGTYTDTTVPNASAVMDYIGGKIPDPYVGSMGVYVNNTTHVISAVVDSGSFPWMALTGYGIGVSSASVESGRAGVVKVADTIISGNADVTYLTAEVPNVSAVIDYVDGKLPLAYVGINGVTVTGNTINTVIDPTAPWMTSGAAGLYVSSATTTSAGVVMLKSSLALSDKTTHDKAPTIGAVVSYVSGSLPSAYIGSSGVDITGYTVTAKIDDENSPWMYATANGIGVYGATVDVRAGVVSVDSEVASNATYATHVPTVSAVKKYVDTSVGKKQDTFLLGYGITSSPNAITGATVYAKVHTDEWMQLDANGIGVQAAYVDNGTLHAGVVKVADLVISGSTFTYSENTVPNVSAMFDYVASALPAEYTSGTTINGGTVKAVVDATNYAWMRLTANGIGVVSAVAEGSTGVVSMTSAFTSANSAVHTKVPTVGAVVNYVSTALPSTYTSGVTITGGTVKAVVDSGTYAWMKLTANGIGVDSATVDGIGGAVKVGGTVTNSTGYGTTVPTVSAVKDYVDIASGNLRSDVDKKQGAFQIASGITSSVNVQTGVTTLLADVKDQAWMILDATGIGVSSAVANGSVGVVSMTSAFTSADSTAHAKTPTVGAVVNYVASQIDGAALNYTAGVKKTGTTVSADLVASTLTSGNIVLNNNQMYVRDATSANRGAVMIQPQQYLGEPYTAESDPSVPTVRAMQNWLVHPKGSAIPVAGGGEPPPANWQKPWMVVGTGLKISNGAIAYDATSSSVTVTPVSIGLTSATQADIGGVYIEPFVEVDSTYGAADVPTVGAMQSYVSSYVETYAPMPGLATTESSGVVTLADTVTSTTTAVLPTGAAIVNYVGEQITSSAYSLPDATVQSKGGVYLIDSVTNISGNTIATGAAIITYVGDQITSAKPTYTSGVTSATANGVTSVYADRLTTDVVSANIVLKDNAHLYVQTANTTKTGAVRIIDGGNIQIQANGSGGISVRAATDQLDGTVKLATTIGTSPSTSAVPPASVVSSYVDGALLGYLSYELL